MLYRYFLPVLLLFVGGLPYVAEAQQNNIWVFGSQQGSKLDFNILPPVLSNSAMEQREGCASVCDPLGNLMFYSNGNKVWDRNNNVMPNGSGLTGNGYSTTMYAGSSAQGVVIVPVNLVRYYIFEVDPNVVMPGYLQYSIVDMTLNNGLGDIVPGEKNIRIDSNIHESMIAIKSADCASWIVVHEAGNDIFKAFKIDQSGLNSTPVISHAGRGEGWYASVSPANDRIAYAGELFKFDNSTGIVSDLIFSFDASIANGNPFGSCFSPDGSKLYMTNLYFNVDQYDLSLLPDTMAVKNSRVVLTSDRAGGMRRGRDGKIYFPSWMQASISVIENPDIAGVACGLTENAIVLPQGHSVGFEIGEDAASWPFSELITASHDTGSCGITTIPLSAPAGYDTYIWSNGSTSRTINAASSGTLWVYSIKACSERIDTFRVRLAPISLDLGKDQDLCEDTKIILNENASGSQNPIIYYSWQDGSILPTFEVEQPGKYWVTISVDTCHLSDTVNITYHNCNCIYLVPNAFSPNGDGANDIFLPKFNCDITKYQMRIYNRWGQLVFSSRNNMEGWNGRHNNKYCDVGTYYYYLEFEKNIDDSKVKLKGGISLVR
jgi:gliding motility-associated-like protein